MSFVLTGVSYTYRSEAPPVFRNLSLTIPEGQTTAILGASGTGKSTLLNLLGLLWEGQLASGSIRFQPSAEHMGCLYSSLGPRERAQLRREAFGFVPQNSYLLPGFTCAQNIIMPLVLQGQGERHSRQRLDELLADKRFTTLRQTLDRYGSEIAGGERQRAAVLRAIIHHPRVIFADEPVSNLDWANTQIFLQLLREWQENKLGSNGLAGAGHRTLLLVCHDAETAWNMAGGNGTFVFLYPRPDDDLDGSTDTPVRLLTPGDLPGGPDDIRRYLVDPP